MPGQLREVQELQDAVEASGFRGTRKQDLLDTLQGQAKIGGAFHLNGGAADFTIVNGWNRLDVWTAAVDTQGIKDGTADATDPGGWFGITNPGAGDYDFRASFRFSATLAGEYEIRVAYVESDGTINNTPFHDAFVLGAGGSGQLVIAAGVRKNLLKDERLQLEMRAPNGSVITPLFGAFGAFR